MRFLSLCSGIEAASVAWAPMGWKAAAVAEIEAFPSAVLAHHYPDVPNLGDITKFKEWPDLGSIDLICGGTPCQSFSVAGLRKGLADPRGNLSLTFLAIVDRYRPRYVVWENVPGVLSSNGGRDFAAFLGGLGQLGYGWSFRVLDAQFCRVDGFPRAVPQRRRRVFVVGYLGDWRRAAAVLSEPESVLGNSPPRRESGQGTATDVVSSLTASGRGVERTGETRGQDPVIAVDAGLHLSGVPGGERRDMVADVRMVRPRAFGGGNRSGPIEVAASLAAHGVRQDFEVETFVCAPPLTGNPYGDHESREGLLVAHQVAETLTSNGDAHSGFPEAAGLVAHSLRAEGFDASEDGTGRGTPIVPVPFDTTQITSKANYSQPKPGDPCHPLAAGAHPPAVAFTCSEQANGFAWERDVWQTLDAQVPSDTSNIQKGVRQGWAVRRLMPVECERLQGFPDDYTNIPYRGKPAADGPRYKALGNSWAVNVARWVGRRIEMVEQIADAELLEAAE